MFTLAISINSLTLLVFGSSIFIFDEAIKDLKQGFNCDSDIITLFQVDSTNDDDASSSDSHKLLCITTKTTYLIGFDEERYELKEENKNRPNGRILKAH